MPLEDATAGTVRTPAATGQLCAPDADDPPERAHADGPTQARHTHAANRSLDGIDLQAFTNATGLEEMLLAWFGSTRLRELCVQGRDAITMQLAVAMDAIESRLAEQTDAILGHPQVQRLEASWRGLSYLAREAELDRQVFSLPRSAIKVKFLNASWADLARELYIRDDIEQTTLFERIYTDQFDMPGGEPFAVIVGDYEIKLGPREGQPIADVDMLRTFASVAASGFSPIVVAASPEVFDLGDSFSALHNPLNLEGTVQGMPHFRQWQSLRRSEDARFLGVVLPRILLRRPYEADVHRDDGFRFRSAQHLWGSAGYAFASVVVRAFAESGWPADIVGHSQANTASGGVVAGLPDAQFATDRPGVAFKQATDVLITETQEELLADMGFIALCHTARTPHAAFMSTQSVQIPVRYDKDDANASARLSVSLRNLLCVGRFAHLIKTVMRDKVGSLMDAAACERYITDWLMKNYVNQSSDPSPEVRAAKPLRNASVTVSPIAAAPGSLSCKVRLQPHYQLEQLMHEVRLDTVLNSRTAT